MELPKLEKFNAFETENADIWIQRYELMCEFSKWDEVQATRAFTCFIDNYALAWYMLLDAEDRNSKDKLFRKFKERFGRKSIEKVGLWKDAADLKQKQNETVSQFISRIERLCFLAGQTVMMEQFILRGLRPEFVVPFVTATGLKQNFSVSEAIDAALLADITMQIVSKPEPVEITSAIKDNPTPQNQPRSDGCSRADCKINVRIGSSVIHTLVDTGAAVSVINTKTYQSLQVDKLYPVDKSDLLGVRGVNDNFIRGNIGKLFAKDITELGCTKIGKHIIDTGDANPVRQFPYRTTPKTKEEINTFLDEMEEQGIIRKSMSPWSSPILLVAKPNGEKRIPLGKKQAQTYSVSDMRQGFWQLELDEQSKGKTAFMTHRGQYEFNRLPYDLANSPATFNMIMNEVIRDLNWKSALVYVDDILIYSKNFEEHLCHLAALFDKLIEANLKLKPSKCQFACKEVQYLGHIITKEGIAVDPEKTASVHSFAAPKNVKEVRMFLGLCNYYRKFIHNYSKITSPLNQLLHKDQQFKWTDECQRSLETLKTKLTSAPILVFPDFNKEFILHTDASGTAIGYVLGQHDKDKKPELLLDDVERFTLTRIKKVIMSDNDESDCFCAQNPNGDVTPSAEESCSPSLDVTEDIKSQIFIEPSNTVVEPLELSLHTTAKGHFIEKSDSLRSPLDIKLSNMDRLLAINKKLVIYWNHWIVLETLKYLLFTSDNEDNLSLIVDRQDSNGKTAIYEICITVMRTRGGAFLEVKSFIKRITYIPRVKCVRFKNLYQCRIRHGFRTNYYLKVDPEQHLSMEQLTSEKQDYCMYQSLVFK
ncbi:unnamed protein product [Mytilus coruscus]|uniref:Retrovirus-related Pol polyprotein from transposon 297,Retrovirus-related Pol polyprotein from transposon 17.6 n=1 Tax=Mytilus coruscus TaxID=42192 RepID=A0A6J8E6J0_MYTCO|nr:unnamed protein product [Mytilus coruscus]